MNEDEEITILSAIAELDAAHRQDGVGCVVCFPQEDSWPCISRLVADDLREIIRRYPS